MDGFGNSSRQHAKQKLHRDWRSLLLSAEFKVQTLLGSTLPRLNFVRATELPTKFSHTRPNGTKCFTAMPIRGHILGENLAGGQTSPKQVVQAWMDSKTHRDNILNTKFTELGVVYYYQANSKYKHYWVQHFRG